jgi:hypothetical protein
MKYGVYDVGESPSSLEEYVEGAHIIVLRTPSDYISTTISLEDGGWEVRDSIKIIFEENSLQAGLFRKPFKGTVASNVIKNGCGGINIDACRIESGGEHENWKPSTFTNREGSDLGKSHIAGSKNRTDEENDEAMKQSQLESIQKLNKMGRFPANLVLSPYASKLMDEQIGINQGNGGASRFFFRFEERDEMIDYLKRLISC